jgi:hypothetical protein
MCQLSSTSVPLHQGQRSHLRDPDIRQGSYCFPPVRNPVVTPSGGMGRGCPTIGVWGQESGGHSSPEKRSYAACRVIPNERPMATHMAPNSVTFGTQ